jgi:hypothetical protein
MQRRIGPMLVVLSITGTAHANGRNACIAAADRGQELRDRRKLVEARERFVACAQDACPPPVRKDCSQWQADVETRLPSVVFVASDERGNDLADVTVTLDERRVTDKLDGTSVNLNPGEHEVVFERTGSPPERLSVIAREGEKNRQLRVVLKTSSAKSAAMSPELPAPPPSPPPERRSLVPSLVLWGAGAVTIGASLLVGFGARSDVDDLRRSCGGHCSDDAVDSARERLVLADVGVGLGLVALAVGTYLALTRGPSEGAPITSSTSSTR